MFLNINKSFNELKNGSLKRAAILSVDEGLNLIYLL